VRYDGAGAFEIRFPFDRGLVELIKTLPGRRWNAAERFWSVPEPDIVQLLDLLEPRGFSFDAAAWSRYRELGGSAPLPRLPRASPAGPRLSGLFDEPQAEPAEPAPSGTASDFTVTGLNERVREVLEAAFPAAIWLVGEISGFNRNAHKRHVTFQLDERAEDGRTRSSVNATLFDRARAEIERKLARAGAPFRLEDETTVRVLVRVELYVPWGSYRVVVEELDVDYTLGEAARRREEIVRRLAQAGLVGRNTALPLPALPLRVGLVTSLGSDAYNDVLRTLEESKFAFRLLVHGARVQGRATEPSVLNALDALRERADQLDVVLICRGGGSRTDLAWFDSEALGRAVALFPLPVVVGIGHEQDRSVLDEVARTCKTPTAAAALLVETVRRSLEAVEAGGGQVLALAAARLQEERRCGTDRARRLGLAARALLERERVELGHRRARTVRGARALVSVAVQRVERWVRDVPRAAAVHLVRQWTFLDHVRRTVAQSGRRDLASARHRLADRARAMGPAVRRRLIHESERTAARDRRLQLVDPRRVLGRGYAILRTAEGGVLSAAALAPAGALLTAELKQGRLRVRSEGPAGE